MNPTNSSSSKHGSERRKRTDMILVRVTPDEKMRLKALAATAGMTVPELLRSSSLCHRPISIVDKEPVRKLCKIAADLGRLGGLLKLWLSEFDNYTARSDIRKREIRALLAALNTSAHELNTRIKNI